MRSKLIGSAVALCLIGGSVFAGQLQPADGGGGGGIGMNNEAARKKMNTKIEPPTLNLKSEETATWPMIATVLIVGACVLVAIIPPKRGHQD